jgi:NitT/TauT family transport system permease protein
MMTALVEEPAASRPFSRRQLLRTAAKVARVLGIILILCAIWETVCRLTGVRPYIFPSPANVLHELIADPFYLLENSAYTIGASLLGFALSVVIGLTMAVGIVYSKFLDSTLLTTLVASNAVPKVAIAPLFILWVGTGIESKVLMALLVSIFPMVVDSVVGLRSADPGMLELARTYKGSTLQMFWKIRFPNALPSIFAGMKVAISLSLIGTIVGEFVGSNRGLGYVILQSQGTYNTSRVFATILLLTAIGIVYYQVVDLIERKAMPWHVTHRHLEDED